MVHQQGMSLLQQDGQPIQTRDSQGQQGDVVGEDRPQQFKYRQVRLKANGPPTLVGAHVCVASDPKNIGAPMYLGQGELK